MRLSTNFTLAEFVQSDTAQRIGIDNALPIELTANAQATADMLERIRAYLVEVRGRNIPIIITSGYRSPQLNRAIGSGDTSDHRKALAADFRAPAFGTPLEVCKALAPAVGVLGVGQIIYEHSWIHVSTRIPDKVINRIITVSGKNYIPGIVEA